MPKACDACQVSSAVVYCRADAAYLCVSCDSKVHGANKLASRHERVWVCEVCELAPAVVTCKADAAALCVSCDAEIHSANPLARRHERLPITPFYECPSMIKVAHIHSAVMGSGAAVNTGLELMSHKRTCNILQGLEEDENTAAEAASWLLSRPHRTAGQLDMHQEQSLSLTGDAQYPVNLSNSIPRPPQQMHGRMPKPKSESQSPDLFSDVDPYLDLDYAHKAGMQSVVTDSIVPIHSSDVPHHLSPSISNASASIELRVHSKQHPYSTAVSHCVSTSSLEAGVVPDASEISTSYDPASAQFEFPPRVLHVGQLQPMAREARVMRYREKRKNRKFEKTIRYASRKAYAESRPRIKGRFAKRDEKEAAENLYGIVPEPSFQSSF